jgi:two-component sensor histidine kinase
LRNGGNGKGAFVARLHALAKAQDVITERGDGGAFLEDVVQRVLQSFGSRISIEGPKIHLKPSLAQGFALVVHELATNAAKHGALSHDTGTVQVRWLVTPAATKSLIHFKWQERGGPASEPPKRRGFGTVLLERAVASSGSPPRFDYAPEGLTYELCTSLPMPTGQAEQLATAGREAESRGLTPKAAGETLRAIARKMSGTSAATK